MYSKLLKIVLITSLTLFFVQKLYAQSIDDTTLAVRIGDVKISNYETTKQYEHWLEKYSRENGKQPKGHTIEKWKDQFLNISYLLADAYAKGYDNNSSISRQVKHLMRYNLTKRNGIVYEVLANEKVKISDQQWREIYEKRDSLYYFEYIKFRDSTQLYNLIENPESLTVTNESFHRIKANICKNDHIECRSDKQKWPFVNIWGIEQTLYEMRPGTYSSFITSESVIYLLHLKKKEFDEKKSIDFFMENFPPIYKKIKSSWRMQQYFKQILNHTKFGIHEANLKGFLQILDSQENKIRPNMNAFSSILDNKIIHYTMDADEIEVTIEDFLKFYKNIFLKSPLDNKTTVEHYLEWMVQEEYIYRQAIQMGITESPKYLLEKQHIKNGLILKAYEKNEIDIEPITEEELQVAYENNKEKFKHPNKIVLTEFIFNEPNEAFNIVQQLRDRKIDENSIIETSNNLKEYTLNDTLDYKKNKYSAEVNNMILQSPDNTVGPLNTEKGFQVYIRKNVIGMEYAPIDNVVSYLKSQIQREKYVEAKEKLVPKLKQKYDMEIHNFSLN